MSPIPVTCLCGEYTRAKGSCRCIAGCVTGAVIIDKDSDLAKAWQAKHGKPLVSVPALPLNNAPAYSAKTKKHPSSVIDLPISAVAFGRAAPKRKWSNAVKTVCNGGHTHASKMEGRVCERLTARATVEGWDLRQQVRFPLLALGNKMYLTVDFVLWRSRVEWHALDAKAASRVSRDWRRGAAAFEATYGRRIEEIDK